MITKEGWHVIDTDSHISKWVIDSGRLDIQEGQILPWCKNVPPDGIIIDAGAFIGDTAATFSKVCGKEGSIYCFEPNPVAYECLKMNARRLPGVFVNPYGLGERQTTCNVVADTNAGASFLNENNDPSKGVLIIKLDEFNTGGRVNLIKIDCEGFEIGILKGAKETIKRDKPDLLIECNEFALKRYGHSKLELVQTLEELGYTFEVTDEKLKWDRDPQCDLFCTYCA